jgi:hypothetical protein
MLAIRAGNGCLQIGRYVRSALWGALTARGRGSLVSLFALVGIAGDDDIDAPDLLVLKLKAAGPGPMPAPDSPNQANGPLPSAGRSSAATNNDRPRRDPGLAATKPVLPAEASERRAISC